MARKAVFTLPSYRPRDPTLAVKETPKFCTWLWFEKITINRNSHSNTGTSGHFIMVFGLCAFPFYHLPRVKQPAESPNGSPGSTPGIARDTEY